MYSGEEPTFWAPANIQVRMNEVSKKIFLFIVGEIKNG
jgi:hypothetical protein